MFLALLPVLVFFFLFQLAFLKLRKKQLVKVLAGILYTFIGLLLFLTGVNVGFMPVGSYLGKELVALPYRWILVPIGMVIGFFIVKAEPAVLVLNKQVEEISGGAISQKTMMNGLSIGWRCRWLIDDPDFNRDFNLLVFSAWVCLRTAALVRGAKNFYGNCI